jgi:hypothetical protein
MARYECSQCGTIGENTTCLNCGSTQLRKLEEAPLSDPVKESIEQQSAALAEAQAPVRAAAAPRKETPKASPPPKPAAEQRPPASVVRMPRAAEPAAAAVAETREQTKIVNLDQFEMLMKRGVKAVIICGGSQAGKSEIARGFTRARKMLRGRTSTTMLGSSDVRYDVDALGGTVPGTVWYQLIDHRHAFFDPSGEFFNRFSARYRKDQNLGDVDESYFDFVRTAVRKLAGIVLVFDLTNITDPTAENPWQEQESVLEYTLQVLRWLRFDKKPRDQEMELRARMGMYLEKHKRKRLDVPVLVLFSKADRLVEYDYTNEHPLSFARNNLPTLHAALLTNARRFRFDYAHTMVHRGDIDYPAKYPCGVLLPIEWLIGDPFSPLRQLPTSLLGGGK